MDNFFKIINQEKPQEIIDLENSIQNFDGLKFLKFSTPTCNPCKTVKEIMMPYCEQRNILYIDIDVTVSMYYIWSHRLKITGVPDMFLLNKNNEVIIRTHNYHLIKEEIEKILNV